LLLEDSDEGKAFAEADEALKISSEAVARWPSMRPLKCWPTVRPMIGLRKSHEVNPNYGEGYALVAHHLVFNRRYVDGIASIVKR